MRVHVRVRVRARARVRAAGGTCLRRKHSWITVSTARTWSG